jgi:single-strand DNA-binding protein
MADNAITIVGNITKDPELKFLGSGNAACKFSVAVNRRWQNKQTQEWEERVSYFDVDAFGQLGENIANSLARGSRVIVTGRLEQRTWETDAGEKRSVIEIKADEVGPALSYATAAVTKIERPQGARSNQGGAF